MAPCERGGGGREVSQNSDKLGLVYCKNVFLGGGVISLWRDCSLVLASRFLVVEKEDRGAEVRGNTGHEKRRQERTDGRPKVVGTGIPISACRPST